MRPAAVGQRAHRPEHDVIGGKGVGREVQHQRGQRPGQRRHRNPAQDQGQASPAPARKRQHQRHARPRAGQRAKRHGHAQRRGAGLDGDHRPQRGRGRYPDDPRLGQRVAQQALQRRARQAQAGADHDAQNGARGPDLAHDQPQRALARDERAQTVGPARTGRPDQQRDDRQCRRQGAQQRKQQGKAGHRASSAASASRPSASATCGTAQVHSASGTARRRAVI